MSLVSPASLVSPVSWVSPVSLVSPVMINIVSLVCPVVSLVSPASLSSESDEIVRWIVKAAAPSLQVCTLH